MSDAVGKRRHCLTHSGRRCHDQRLLGKVVVGGDAVGADLTNGDQGRDEDVGAEKGCESADSSSPTKDSHGLEGGNKNS